MEGERSVDYLDVPALKSKLGCFTRRDLSDSIHYLNAAFNSYHAILFQLNNKAMALRSFGRLAWNKFIKSFVDVKDYILVLSGSLLNSFNKEEAQTTSELDMMSNKKGDHNLNDKTFEREIGRKRLDRIAKKLAAQTASAGILEIKDDCKKSSKTVCMHIMQEVLPENGIIDARESFEPGIKAVKSFGYRYYQQNKTTENKGSRMANSTELVAFLKSHGASIKKITENQLQFHIPKPAFDELCVTEGVDGAIAQAEAHCHTIIGTSLKLLQVDKELDISTEDDGISVMCGQSGHSLLFEDHTGELAASLQQFSKSHVSEGGFQSCISGGDEGDSKRVIRQKYYRKTRHSGYPSYRIRFNGMPWKGYDSLQTFAVEDDFANHSRIKPTHEYSSSDDGSDLEQLRVYEKIQNY